MILLNVDEIVSLHNKLIDRTDGSSGVRDYGLPESAVYSSESSFADEEVYPTVEEKAARLCYALTNNHAFVDGNKRIGVFTMLMTLRLNSIALDYTQRELITLGLSIADGSCNYDNILIWIKKHKK